MTHTPLLLILDANEITRAELSQHITAQGYRFALAESSEQALDMLQSISYAAIFLDIVTADSSSNDLLKYKIFRYIPVIMVATANDFDRVAHYIELGAEDYVLRPFHPVLVGARLKAVIEKRQLISKQNQDVETINQKFAEFVGMWANALKGPLSIIQGYANVLTDYSTIGTLNEKQSEFMAFIKGAVEHQFHLIDNMRDLVTVETNSLRIRRESLSPGKVISDAIQPFTDKILAKTQTLIIQIPESLPPIYADEFRLNQILTYLIDNAHRYTPEGGEISLKAEVIPGGIEVVVQDNGIGISPDEHTHVFVPFWRSPDPQVREMPGMGLSLYIAKGIIEAHDGRLWFESEPGIGSKFHFTLPIASAEKQ